MTLKCAIRWIDKQGKTTEDTSDAVCLAVSTLTYPAERNEPDCVRRFPCCAKHAEHLDRLAAKGPETVRDGDRVLYTSGWTREAL